MVQSFNCRWSWRSDQERCLFFAPIWNFGIPSVMSFLNLHNLIDVFIVVVVVACSIILIVTFSMGFLVMQRMTCYKYLVFIYQSMWTRHITLKTQWLLFVGCFSHARAVRGNFQWAGNVCQWWVKSHINCPRSNVGVTHKLCMTEDSNQLVQS